MAAPSSSSKDGAMSVITTGVIDTVFSVHSKVLKEKQSFTWIVEDFDLVRTSDELISGQKCQFEAGDAIGLPTRWEFYLDHCERDEQVPKSKWICIYLKLLEVPENGKKVTAKFGIDCKKLDGSSFYNNVAATPRLFDNTSTKKSWGWCQFIKQDELLKDLPLVNGSLTVNAEFTLYAVKPPVLLMDVSTQLKAFETKAIQKLIKDLGKSQVLTGSNVDSVTKLVSKTNVEFSVNRGLLSTRSIVFQSMFQSGMKEDATGIVHIDDLSTKTISVLLHYLTTGTLRESWNSPEVILELPYAAQKYDLKLLVDFLDNVLGSVCTIGNAQQLATLANKLGMKKAERDLLAFIENKAVGRK